MHVRVCVCMCVNACMCLCVRVCICVHRVWAHASVWVHVCIHARTHTPAHAEARLGVNLHVCALRAAWLCTHTCACGGRSGGVAVVAALCLGRERSSTCIYVKNKY